MVRLTFTFFDFRLRKWFPYEYHVCNPQNQPTNKPTTKKDAESKSQSHNTFFIHRQHGGKNEGNNKNENQMNKCCLVEKYFNKILLT